ncbi:MAG TPA: hypothetical protein VHS36_10025, partial [Candidatus Limnocylindrales bacterium]|nr:hypothetical protein [Candidatus Limnocylindrales bacterium]
VPPPVLTRPRDFRLTSEQAARLRPRGWRRMLGAFGGPRLAFAKPLGIALTTIGLAGLLVTNIPLGLGGASSAAAPAAAPVDMSAASSDVTGESSTGNTGSYGGVLAPAGSGVPAASRDVAAPAPAASAASAASAGAASSAPAAVGSQAPPDRNLSAAPQAAASGRLEAGGPKTQSSAQPNTAGGAPTDQSLEPARPMDLRILFGAAVVVGLALLVLRRVGRRVPSA